MQPKLVFTRGGGFYLPSFFIYNIILTMHLLNKMANYDKIKTEKGKGKNTNDKRL